MLRKLIHISVAFFAGALVWHFALICAQTLAVRNGMIGGEVLFLPMLALVFSLGWSVRSELTKESWREDEQDVHGSENTFRVDEKSRATMG